MDRLIEIIEYYYDGLVTKDLLLKDLNLNELDQVDLFMDIEDEFDISVDEEEYSKLKTLNDLYSYIKENME